MSLFGFEGIEAKVDTERAKIQIIWGGNMEFEKGGGVINRLFPTKYVPLQDEL